MSAQKYGPQVLVLPEDDANKDIANGFFNHDAIDQRAVKILPCAGGWSKVRDAFSSDHVTEMQKYPKRYMVLLVDFDEKSTRFDDMTKDIPEELAATVNNAVRKKILEDSHHIMQEKLNRSERLHRFIVNNSPRTGVLNIGMRPAYAFNNPLSELGFFSFKLSGNLQSARTKFMRLSPALNSPMVSKGFQLYISAK